VNDSGPIPWRFQVLTGPDVSLRNAVTGESFPCIEVGQLRAYEIHGPAVRGDLSNSVCLTTGNGLDLTLSYQRYEEGGSHHQRRLQFEPFFDQVMDSMLHVVREGLKNEKFSLETHYWPDINDLLFDNDQDDPAKYSLVVDLARPNKLIEPLNKVTDRPKRILRRIHDQERVQKVREIDTKCLVDLAKRPGVVLAEKAGPKQRILAIKRTESIDTLENRVTRHCCDLLSRASRRYLNEHSHISSEESKRVDSVRKLQRVAWKIPRKDSFEGVRSLIQPCRQPNYTLLQNADYSRIWKSYIQLVRNEDLRNQFWMWNRRLWVDYMKVYLSYSLLTFVNSLDPEAVRMMGHKTILSKRRHESGRWLLDDSLPGPFLIRPGSDNPLSLYALEGSRETLEGLATELAMLSALNADMLVITSRRGNLSVLPVYALLPSHHLDDSAHGTYIENMLPEMSRALSRFNAQNEVVRCVGGWVLLGNWRNVGHSESGQEPGTEPVCWLTSVPADSRKWVDGTEGRSHPMHLIFGV
jgi:hypothetical protein